MKKIFNLKFLLLVSLFGLVVADTSLAADFFNPLKYDTPKEIILIILDNLRGILAVLSIIFIVIGGLMYITSAGNQGRMDKAKSTITYALIGFAIAAAAPTFLKEIAEVLGFTDTPSELEGAQSLASIILSVISFLLGIVGSLALILLIVGGIMYMGSAGDQTRIDTARKMVTYAIIGVAVSLAALVIVSQIGNFFA